MGDVSLIRLHRHRMRQEVFGCRPLVAFDHSGFQRVFDSQQGRGRRVRALDTGLSLFPLPPRAVPVFLDVGQGKVVWEESYLVEVGVLFAAKSSAHKAEHLLGWWVYCAL